MKNNLQNIPTRNPVHYRTYSRNTEQGKETLEQALKRSLLGIQKLGKLTDEQTQLIKEVFETNQVLPSGRWLWISNTEWIEDPDNYSGAYNCEGIRLEDWSDFALNFDDLHKGCGVGTTITEEEINSLPVIVNSVDFVVASVPGELWNTNLVIKDYWKYDSESNTIYIEVSDTRQGWTKAYQHLLEASSNTDYAGNIKIVIDFGYIRPSGTPIKGFGGVANPDKLVEGFEQVVSVLNKAAKEKRKLNVLEICLLLNIAGFIAVSGNIRRSARINQADKDNELFTTCKDNLWIQDKEGNWIVDKERDVLRFSNHTRLFYSKPTKEEIKEAVVKQYYSSEGAIMYVPNALIRTNIDLLDTKDKQEFFKTRFEISKKIAKDCLAKLLEQYYMKCDISISNEEFEKELNHRFNRINMNPSLVKGTKVFTTTGIYNIEDLENKVFEVITHTEEKALAKCFLSGLDKDIYKITLKSKHFYECTKEHKWIVYRNNELLRLTTDKLIPGDKLPLNKKNTISNFIDNRTYEEGLLAGFVLGDGSFSFRKDAKTPDIYIFVSDQKSSIIPVLEHTLNALGSKAVFRYRERDKGYEFCTRNMSIYNFFQSIEFDYHKEYLPSVLWNSAGEAFIKGFIDGIISSDGCVQTNTLSPRISFSSSKLSLVKELSELLGFYGIKTNLNNERVTLGDFPNNKQYNKQYLSYSLRINKDSSIRFAKLFKLSCYKQQFLDKLKELDETKEYQVITDISLQQEKQDVWDITVYHEDHSFDLAYSVTGNCGEILG